MAGKGKKPSFSKAMASMPSSSRLSPAPFSAPSPGRCPALQSPIAAHMSGESGFSSMSSRSLANWKTSRNSWRWADQKASEWCLASRIWRKSNQYMTTTFSRAGHRWLAATGSAELKAWSLRIGFQSSSESGRFATTALRIPRPCMRTRARAGPISTRKLKSLWFFGMTWQVNSARKKMGLLGCGCLAANMSISWCGPTCPPSSPPNAARRRFPPGGPHRIIHQLPSRHFTSPLPLVAMEIRTREIPSSKSRSHGRPGKKIKKKTPTRIPKSLFRNGYTKTPNSATVRSKNWGRKQSKRPPRMQC